MKTEAPEDLVLTPPPEPKLNRHVKIALNHMNLQLAKVNAKIDALTAERDGLEEAIKSLK